MLARLIISFLSNCLIIRWHFIALIVEKNPELSLKAETWMSAAGIIDEGWLVKYLNSYYFSIVLNCFSFF